MLNPFSIIEIDPYAILFSECVGIDAERKKRLDTFLVEAIGEWESDKENSRFSYLSELITQIAVNANETGYLIAKAFYYLGVKDQKAGRFAVYGNQVD